MNNERGSITLPCIIIAAIMLALASSLLVFTTREYEHTRSYVRSRQLRLLTLSTLEQAERFADGRQVLLEKIFLPDKDKVVLILNKTQSSDGLIKQAEVLAEATRHNGAMQGFRQLKFQLASEQQALVREYAMIGKRFTGLEHLDAEARYIQAQEVSLPQVSFMEALNSSVTANNIAIDGFSSAFYYINGTFTFPSGGKTLSGSTVFVTRGNMLINANTRFPGRVALISHKGMITINKNCRFDNALLMAQSGVYLKEGCNFTGCIIAPSIVVEGRGHFTPSAAVAEPFISAITLTNS